MTHKGSFNFITQTVFSGTIKNWMITIIIVSDHTILLLAMIVSNANTRWNNKPLLMAGGNLGSGYR